MYNLDKENEEGELEAVWQMHLARTDGHFCHSCTQTLV
jgi:hypothetical protein